MLFGKLLLLLCQFVSPKQVGFGRQLVLVSKSIRMGSVVIIRASATTQTRCSSSVQMEKEQRRNEGASS
jgi:hypothetical protein